MTIKDWPTERFTTIYADPPWSFNDKGSRLAPDCDNHFDYHTFSYEQICSLPVSALSTDKAHLYLWTPAAFLKEGIELCEKWGFEYKLPLVWIKTTKDGEKVRIFGGHYFRHSHEFCLFAVKNKLGTNTNNTSTVVMAENRGHSRKPLEFYNLIESNSPGPYIELFARGRQREGWVFWGDEVVSVERVDKENNIYDNNYHNDI